MGCSRCVSSFFTSAPFTTRAFGSLASISRAMAKSAGARARSAGVLAVSAEASQRVAVCRRCPLYQVTAGGVGYCGKPFLHKVLRKPSLEGCGCPVQEKAKAPGEHCPLNRFNQPAGWGKGGTGGKCDCKWCALGRS